MAVTAISFALPFHFFKALWVKEYGQLIWIFFKSYRFATVTNWTIQETLYDFCYFQFDFCFFSTFSVLSAQIDLMLCVDFVFWKKLSKCFQYFSIISLFLAVLGIQSTPLFLGLKKTALCTMSNTWPFLTTICHWIDTWTVYRKSPHVDMWNTMGPITVATLHFYRAVKSEICSWEKSTIRHCGGQYCTFCSQYIFRMCLQKRKSCFLSTLHKNRERFVA